MRVFHIEPDSFRELPALPEQLRGHLVIAGFGRAGRLVADVLDQTGLAQTLSGRG